MTVNEILYDINSIAIVVILLALILIANEVSYRLGQRLRGTSDDGVVSQTNAIQAGTLGLLALLLGFSFNMALQRFDTRSASVIDEANAIGTTYLRTELLPEVYSAQYRSLLVRYVDLRVEASRINMANSEQYEQAVLQTQELQAELWRLAVEASNDESSTLPVISLFLQALNSAIDSYANRQAQLQKHVPEIVLLLLFTIFIVSGSLLGFAAGLNGSRPIMATISMAILIVLVIFIVIDLDRPRRGLIQVDQSSLLELQRQIAG